MNEERTRIIAGLTEIAQDKLEAHRKARLGAELDEQELIDKGLVLTDEQRVIVAAPLGSISAKQSGLLGELTPHLLNDVDHS